jgi:hypothetical protein
MRVAGRTILRWKSGRAFPLFVKVNIYRTLLVATDGEGGHVAPVEQQLSFNGISKRCQDGKNNICGIAVEDYVLDKSTQGIYKALAEGRRLRPLPSSEREARMDDPRGPTPFLIIIFSYSLDPSYLLRSFMCFQEAIPAKMNQQ